MHLYMVLERILIRFLDRVSVKKINLTILEKDQFPFLIIRRGYR